MVHHSVNPRGKEVHLTPPFRINILFKVMFKRNIVVFFLHGAVRDISQMATLCNFKICTLYVKPESLISSRFVNTKSRESESSCFEIFDLLLHSWEKHASDLVLVPGSHYATGVILFLL